MDTVTDALDQATTAQVFTRPMPRSTAARVRFLLAQERTPNRAAAARALAARLGVTQRTVERWRDGLRKQPPPALDRALTDLVRQQWQPRVRRRAADAAAATGGITIAVRGTFGYTADTGTTDESRMRRITHHLAPDVAADLLARARAGASEDELRRVLADALRDAYFRDGGRRAHQLRVVELTHVDSLQMRLGG